MSTKTTFKRIALVAVAALGLGVLSVAPSSATVTGLTVTVADGTAGLAGVRTDSTTAATVNVAGLLESSDSVTVSLVTKAVPAASTPVIGIQYLDSSTPSVALSTRVDTNTALTTAALDPRALAVVANVSVKDTATSGVFRITTGDGTKNVSANFGVQLDSATSTRPAGTYTYTVLVRYYDGAGLVQSIAKDVSIVIAKSASVSTTANPGTTTSYIGTSNPASSDAAVSAVATADTTDDAYITVTIPNPAGGTGYAQDSVTATVTGAGVISFDDATFGKSITYSATAGTATIYVRGDGTAGVGSIAISTKSGYSAVKTVTFYAKAAKTFTGKVQSGPLQIGANDSAVAVTAVDASGVNWGGQAYIVAATAADALIGGSATTPVACVYVASKALHWCPISTIGAGTANFKIIDASTVALATATSDAISVTASAALPATLKIEFDKATYLPYEKAYIKVSVLDAAGKSVGAKDVANALASGGISTNISFSGTVPDLTSTTASISAVDGTDKFGGYKTYVVYMPATGDVTISAKGGTALPIAGQVTVSATASVVNSSVDAATDAANQATDAANAATDAALAAADAADAATAAAQDASDAVAALSASVEKLVASLKAQITSLTNLVIKIQKKVKA